MLRRVFQEQCSAPVLHATKRTATIAIQGCFGNMNMWQIPFYGQEPTGQASDLRNLRYYKTRSREQWAYDRVDENINSSSEFRDTSKRPSFGEGTRPDNSKLNSGDHGVPSKYRLYEYFDEYTKPGQNRKIAAAYAVKEHWDSQEFYYPGETWAKDKPGFRSVPKEMLNRDTLYGDWNFVFQNHKLAVTNRTRSWNPQWPPPGYKMQKLQCKKEFTFGVEDPSLVTEIERYSWYRAWQEMNYRLGKREFFSIILLFFVIQHMSRNHGSRINMSACLTGLNYPGRHFIRHTGTPKNWETECFWFQKPLEEFPNCVQPMITHMRSRELGYTNYLKVRDEIETKQLKH